jgi:hypothetical protein
MDRPDEQTVREILRLAEAKVSPESPYPLNDAMTLCLQFGKHAPTIAQICRELIAHTAERDAALAEVERLRAKCHEAVVLLERWENCACKDVQADIEEETAKFLAAHDAEEAKPK